MFLIEAALWLLTWEFPHSGCFATAYLRISLLKLPYSCLLENFLIEAASWLLAWEFPHWGCLVAVYLRISSLGPHWNCLLEKFLFEAGGYLLENFLIGAASRPLTWEFPHWGCLAAAYFIISSLSLSCDCFPGNFLIGPPWDCLLKKFLIEAGGCLLENFLIEAASRPLT